MIDDDSNELIPSHDGDGDTNSTRNDSADDVQSVTIIQDEQGITFLGDAGAIDLWLKDEASIPRRSSQSRADRLDGEQRRTGGRQRHGRKRAMGEAHQGIGRTGC